MKVYAFVLSLIVMAGCTASRYQTPIQALADQGSPMQGANSSTLSALHILQAEDTANGKLLLYFLSDAKTEMAVTRVDRRKEDSWQAVASDQQYISDRSGTTSDDPNSISAFSSVLGQSPTYSVVYGFNRIVVTCKSVDFGGFLLFRAGNHVLDKIEINHEGCSTSTQQTDETAEIAPCIGSTINWVNYIKLNDIQYAGASPGQGYSIEPEMLGEEIAQVEFMVNCHADIGYKSKNGDAAYLR